MMSLRVGPERALGMARSYPSFVAGLAHRNRQGQDRGRYAAQYVALGDRLELVCEPDNPHDADAVAVLHTGFHLGYIPERHDWVCRSITDGDTHRVIVTGLRTEGWW